MNTINAVVFQPASNLMDFKLIWVNEVLHIANRIYSQEVKVENAFFNDTDPVLISCMMEQHLKSEGTDILYIIHNIECNPINLMGNAFQRTGRQLPRRFTLVHIMDDKVKALVHTSGVFNGELCYTDVLKLKAETIDVYLSSVK